LSRSNLISPLETDPNAAAPVAASLVLAPPISGGIGITPLPIVAINMNPDVRRVVIALLNMPAIAVLIANNGGRRTGYAQGKNAGSP